MAAGKPREACTSSWQLVHTARSAPGTRSFDCCRFHRNYRTLTSSEMLSNTIRVGLQAKQPYGHHGV
eukprot:CAMPEP_0180506176 /NCGR_PEP_ID=MMETSP1036_2-20121128/47821_1 /TAXON_ID=632150 /ORGANISM="Azadinium spinosum, Strain 3D9" /LENGTH=66 /DNA_ID=CAMNT_0022516043 /DNA_START=99 /DNA_END=299 /DNA_ORIENTATION=+